MEWNGYNYDNLPPTRVMIAIAIAITIEIGIRHGPWFGDVGVQNDDTTATHSNFSFTRENRGSRKKVRRTSVRKTWEMNQYLKVAKRFATPYFLIPTSKTVMKMPNLALYRN
jgi:hypothetical protein